MIILQAPFESGKTTIYLPSPVFNDTVGLRVVINQKVSINNTRYTYVKRKGGVKLNFTLVLPLEKSFELQAFTDKYISDWIRFINHNDETFRVKFVSDPFTYTYKTRDDRNEILLAFEGTKLNAANINC